MIRFETLLEKVRSYSPEADLELLRRAYVFSALEHKGQVRHSGEPYLVHPLEVADFLADMKLDAVAIAAVHRLFTGTLQVRGQALYASLSYGLGGATGMLLSGWSWSALGPSLTFTISGGFGLAGALLVAWRVRI